MVFNRIEIAKGVNLNIISTDKFKRNFVDVSFILPHRLEYAAPSSLLCDVLTRATQRFPSLLEIERELDECYGATLSSVSNIKGESKVISLCVDFLSNKYALPNDDIFKRTTDLLSDVLFRPCLIDGVFNADFVENEKEKLLAAIGRRRNSKRTYATDRCRSIMCEGEAYSVFSYGTVDDVKGVTAKSLYDFYLYMLDKASVELFFVGDESEEKIVSYFSAMFSDKPRKDFSYQEYPSLIVPDEQRYIVEEADYKQSVLVLGIRTGITQKSELRYAYSLFNAIFGSGVNSKLFRVVREQMHLCYYASNSPDISKGVSFVSSGIDMKNEEIATNAIKDQLYQTSIGNFTDEDIQNCKKAIKNSYKELHDSPESLVGWYLGRVIFGNFETCEQVCDKIMSVTREQIIQVAAKSEIDTIFMLKGVSKMSGSF